MGRTTFVTETSGIDPSLGVAAADLDALRREEGPYLTVYLTTLGDIENAAQRTEQHWRSLRPDLLEQGVDESILDAVELLLPDAHLEGQTLAVVANASGVLHAEHLPEPPRRDFGRWDSLPALVPIVSSRLRSFPHVVVLADRVGADLVAFRPDAPDLHREAGGHEDSPVAKVKAGGWSQRRFQQRAEVTWDMNADDVAKDLTRLVEEVQARLVLVTGDVRAVQLLQDAVPEHVAQKLQVLESGRPADGVDALSSEIDEALDAFVREETRRVLATFREETGQRDLAVEGTAATIAALQASQAAVLLVHDEWDDERRAWFGAEPTQIAATREDAERLGTGDAREGRLVDAVVRAALATGATVRVLAADEAPRDGVGALLRWST